MTSHDVVGRCRRVFQQKRVGHAGTLDPGATGVLLVGLGPSTRLMQFVSGLPKRYTAEVVLGVSTSTLDDEGEVTGTWEMTSISLDEVRHEAQALTGDIQQVPPMVSALKVGGKLLHELARAGLEVERAPRHVRVARLDVDLTDRPGPHGPVLAIDVDCSAGTYVRTLAADLGARLGGGAHLRRLRRHRIGPFVDTEAVTLSALEAEGAPERWVLAPAVVLRRSGLTAVIASRDLAADVAHGKLLPLTALGAGSGNEDGPWAVVDAEGNLLAVYRTYTPGAGKAARAKPEVVMKPAGARATQP
jgi:tRNA pseudouridine55 synthase